MKKTIVSLFIATFVLACSFSASAQVAPVSKEKSKTEVKSEPSKKEMKSTKKSTAVASHKDAVVAEKSSVKK